MLAGLYITPIGFAITLFSGRQDAIRFPMCVAKHDPMKITLDFGVSFSTLGGNPVSVKNFISLSLRCCESTTFCFASVRFVVENAIFAT